MPALALAHFLLVNIHRVSRDHTDSTSNTSWASVLLLEHLSALKDFYFGTNLASLLHVARSNIDSFFSWALRIDHPVVVRVHAFSYTPEVSTLIIFVSNILDILRLIDSLNILPGHRLRDRYLYLIMLCLIFGTFAIPP